MRRWRWLGPSPKLNRHPGLVPGSTGQQAPALDGSQRPRHLPNWNLTNQNKTCTHCAFADLGPVGGPSPFLLARRERPARSSSGSFQRSFANISVPTLKAFSAQGGCRRRVPWLCGRRFRGNPRQIPQPPCRRRAVEDLRASASGPHRPRPAAVFPAPDQVTEPRRSKACPSHDAARPRDVRLSARVHPHPSPRPCAGVH